MAGATRRWRGEVGVVPGDEVGGGLGFVLEAGLHFEFVVGDFVGHLDVANGEVPGEFAGGARLGSGR